MLVPPAQRITTGLGTSAAPANLALAGKTVKIVHIDSQIAQDPTAITRVIQELASSLADTTTICGANPFASSMLIRDLTSVSGVMLVNHMLARPYLGWVVVRPRGVVTIYETPVQPATINPARQLQLTMTPANVLFDLLVF
jgi:hypothetical protein